MVRNHGGIRQKTWEVSHDEAGCGDEAGHDVMWYAIRDAALDNPAVTSDMFENLPIAPPPGYTGPAKPALATAYN